MEQYMSANRSSNRWIPPLWLEIIYRMMRILQDDKKPPKQDDDKPIQQDNNYKEFMEWITDGGLRYAYAKQQNMSNADEYYRLKVDDDQKGHVIIVGAGMAGLSAAYELSQIGHKVTVLEMQSRVGGRVKTFREGFRDGLHCEGGAMRLPQSHYLTKHYIEQFQIPIRPFQNYQKKAYMHLYGDNIKIERFQNNNGHYSDLYWKGWDEFLSKHLKKELNINGILDYFERTMEPVKRELGENPTEEDWHDWIEKWSKLSVEDFLRSTIYQKPNEPKLRPWPEIAIEGYKISSYTPTLSGTIVDNLREDLGQWWKEGELYTPKEGMDTLPKSFVKQNQHGWNTDVNLSKDIMFGVKVEKITLIEGEYNSFGMQSVKVVGINTAIGHREDYNGDAVIVTLPLHILRQIEVPLQHNQVRALANVSYAASTKIMLQCRTRFWQRDVGQGGFSKTNMMIGQLHYPDYDGSEIADDERGVLLVYTWASNALVFGSQTHEDAIKHAVQQITKIHPDMETEFEVGNVQAWYTDPSSQGAYASLKPFEYMSSMKCLSSPVPPIYLAGEALSWSNGWIQGALFSGLMQAFLFQSRAEKFGGDVNPITMLYKDEKFTL